MTAPETLSVAETVTRDPRKPHWLIRKGGYFYCPNFCGYTCSKDDAGRYTKEEADREAKIEPWHMSAVHQDVLPKTPLEIANERADAMARRTAEAEAERDAVKIDGLK